MSSALLQIVAQGAQDAHLTSSPQFTFFKGTHKRHSNFACETIEQQFNGSADFGKTVNLTVSRNGDLVTNMYIRVELPAVEGTASDQLSKFAWCRKLGYSMLEEVEIEIGGTRVDKEYGVWLNLWYELTVNIGKAAGVLDMIGDYSTLTKLQAADPVTGVVKRADILYIPLQFWFCRYPNTALPLVALQYHEVKIFAKFRRSEECSVGTGAYQAASKRKVSLTNASLFVEYVYLDATERNRFAQLTHQYLIDQLQYTGDEGLTSNNPKFKLVFNHPVKEIIWNMRLGNYITGMKFLAYTHGDNWAGALAAATQSIAEGMVKVDVDGFVDTAAGAVTDYTDTTIDAAVTTPPVITTGTSAATAFTVNVTYTGVPLATAVSLHLFNGAVLIGDTNFDLRDRFKTVLLSITGDTPTTLRVSAKATTSNLTIRDISKPTTKWLVDNRSTFVKTYSDVVVYQHHNSGLYIDGSYNPTETATLQLNGHERFSNRDGKYFRSLQPLQHHTNIPTSGGINLYSFALHPEDHQPSGSINMSRIDTAILQLKLTETPSQEGPSEYSLGAFTNDTKAHVWAINYNILKISYGLGGIGYSS